MGGRWTSGWERARRQAEEQYEAQRNLSPVKDLPETLVSALLRVADDLGCVRWVTLGEYRGDGDRVSKLLLGVRTDASAGADFEEVAAAFRGAVQSAIGTRVAVEVVELDADVDETMADGTENPYVVVRPG